MVVLQLAQVPAFRTACFHTCCTFAFSDHSLRHSPSGRLVVHSHDQYLTRENGHPNANSPQSHPNILWSSISRFLHQGLLAEAAIVQEAFYLASKLPLAAQATAVILRISE
jgi:hypothetical protein